MGEKQKHLLTRMSLGAGSYLLLTLTDTNKKNITCQSTLAENYSQLKLNLTISYLNLIYESETRWHLD